jgi:hypothetical protein
MQNIEKYLINLMHQHDCVVIPNFGGLVANYVPGFADEKAVLLHPPKKGFVWNKFLQHNDGLLAHEIGKEEGLSFDQSVAMIQNFVTEINRQLNLHRRFDFDTIGSFFIDDNKVLNFNPKKENYLLSSFGLPIVKAMKLPKLEVELPVKETPVVQLVPEVKEDSKEKVVKTETKIVAITEGAERRKTSNSKWWIAAALIPIGFYSAWIPMKTDLLKPNGNFQYSDLNPFSFDKLDGQYETFVISKLPIDSLASIDFSVFEVEETLDTTVNDFATIETPESTYVDVVVPEINYTPTTETGYFVIGGCFSDKENADFFIKDLKSKGFDAQLVDFHQGLHRVAFGKYASRDEAKEAKSDITSSGEFSAWVLKK